MNKSDINGDTYYVHVDGLYEGGFKNVHEATEFALRFLVNGASHVVIESRANWFSRAEA